jgi:transcription elongation factor GreB|tara:strand:+ start:231 stop:752 length:522 start_codon:yes stop_codon:yes gene_type:complete
MSRAFIKENDLEHAGIDIPERPISQEKNYVTPNGLEDLKNALRDLDRERQSFIGNDNSNIYQKKMRIERDIRYISARLKSAILVNPLTQNKEIVLFSAKVEVMTARNNKQFFEIVGEDEANIKDSKISYLSPLSKLLIGSHINEEVVWNKPSGNEILTITNIYYCGQANPHKF